VRKKREREKNKQTNVGSPSRKDHSICIERTPIVKPQTLRREAGHLGVILEFNLPIDYQLARADVCDFASGESESL